MVGKRGISQDFPGFPIFSHWFFGISQDVITVLDTPDANGDREG